MTRSPRTLLGSVALLAALAARADAQPTESVWEASSGLTPDQVCPSWTLIDTAAATNPTLAAGVLTITTAAGERASVPMSGRSDAGRVTGRNLGGAACRLGRSSR